MIRAELLKLTTVSSTKVAITVGLLGLLATQILAVTLLSATAMGLVPLPDADLQSEFSGIDPGSFGFQYASLSVLGGGGFGASTGSVGIATIAILILGLLVATTDYRFGGIVTAALAEPRRGKLLLGKIAATALTALAVGVAFALVCVAVLIGTGLFMPGVELVVTPLDSVITLGLGVLVIALLALLGLAIGVLVRSQIAGFVVLISIVLLEPIVQGLAQLVSGGMPLWAQFLPQSLAHAALAPLGDSQVPSPVALAALAGIVALALGAASVALRRRDL